MKRFLLIITVVMLLAVKSSAQILSVNTNLFMDAAMAPSVGFELVLNKKSSFALDGFFGTKIIGKHVKVLALQPEWKYYFSGRPMFRHYVGVVGMFEKHDMRIRARWYEGHSMAAGFSFGYVWPVTQRLLIDFHSSLGLGVRDDRTYLQGDNYPAYHTDENGKVYTNSNGTYLCPIKMGINVAYILK